jgi:hypothetical protein
MGYTEVDQKAINTIRLLAVCFSLSLSLSLSLSCCVFLGYPAIAPPCDNGLWPVFFSTPESSGDEEGLP